MESTTEEPLIDLIPYSRHIQGAYIHPKLVFHVLYWASNKFKFFIGNVVNRLNDQEDMDINNFAFPEKASLEQFKSTYVGRKARPIEDNFGKFCYDEREVDRLLINEFINVAGFSYNTGCNRRLFDSRKPDGWFINELHELFIIENKTNISKRDEAMNQLKAYYKLASSSGCNFKIYGVFGCLNDEKLFYEIFDFIEGEICHTDKSFKDFNLKRFTE
jgi:hypothetical protein